MEDLHLWFPIYQVSLHCVSINDMLALYDVTNKTIIVKLTKVAIYNRKNGTRTNAGMIMWQLESPGDHIVTPKHT